MIAIGNQPYYGGGMKIIPHATIQPKNMAVTIVHSISKWKVLALFLTVFTGRHATFKEVELFEATNINLRSEQELVVKIDGETTRCQTAELKKKEYFYHGSQ